MGLLWTSLIFVKFFHSNIFCLYIFAKLWYSQETHYTAEWFSGIITHLPSKLNKKILSSKHKIILPKQKYFSYITHITKTREWVILVHAWNHSSWKAEARGLLKIQDQSGLWNEMSSRQTWYTLWNSFSKKKKELFFYSNNINLNTGLQGDNHNYSGLLLYECELC